MIIAIDAKPLCGPMAGVGIYAKNLVRALQDINADDVFKFYTYYKFGSLVKEKSEIPEDKLAYLYPSVKASSPLLYAMWKYLKGPSIESFIGAADIVHGLSWLLPRTDNAKKIITVYDLVLRIMPETMPFYRVKMLELYLKYSLNEADAIIAISESTKKDITEHYGISSDKITVTHLGVDRGVFRPDVGQGTINSVKEKYSISGDYILYLGTIEPRKGIDRLLKAFLTVKSRFGKPVKLVLAGGIGWKVSELVKQIRSLADGGDLIYTGHVSDSEAAALYNGAKVFVFPSRYEGFGIPVLEAMSCGCPVITAGCSSLPEVAGEAGILFDGDDNEALVEAMLRVLDEDALRKSMSEKGLERSRLFSWEKTAEATRKVYEKVLQGT